MKGIADSLALPRASLLQKETRYAAFHFCFQKLLANASIL